MFKLLVLPALILTFNKKKNLFLNNSIIVVSEISKIVMISKYVGTVTLLYRLIFTNSQFIFLVSLNGATWIFVFTYKNFEGTDIGCIRNIKL